MIRQLSVLLMLAACAPAETRVLALRHVTLIPMTTASSQPGQTVVIRDDRIVAIGPDADMSVPRGATVVDATGKYLIPGLFEMHGHASKMRASGLTLQVLHGITTVRDAGSEHAEVVRWRAEIRDGSRVGPRMLIAGPYLESDRNIERMRADPPESRVEPFERARIGVGSPEEARRVIDSLAQLELDYFKVRTVENRETYLALGAAADGRGMRLVGHAPGGPDLVLEGGQDGVEHGFYFLLDSVPPAQRMSYWRQFATRDIGVVPTLVTFTEAGLRPRTLLEKLVADTSAAIHPLRPFLSRFLVLDWREQAAEATDERRPLLRRAFASTLRDLREMHEAGVRIMAGSDVAVINIFPGATLHEELRLFVDSLGMTPLEALASATRKPAEWLGLLDSVGTIEAGSVADLVLLEANPLENIAHTRRIAAVILRGRYFDRAALDALLTDVAAMPDQRINDWVR